MTNKKTQTIVNNDEKLFGLAQYIINYYNETGVTITHLKLQKLLYFIYGYSLINLKKDIIENEFEAWVNGPVIKKIYLEYNTYGFNNINKIKNKNIIPLNLEEEEKILVDTVLKLMADVDPRQLVAWTHAEGTAWFKARTGLPTNIGSNRSLLKEDIKEEFLSYQSS